MCFVLLSSSLAGLALGCSDAHLLDVDSGSLPGDAGPMGTDSGPPSSDAGPLVCPPGLDPWNPSDPANACSIEGQSCSSGTSDPCGSAMFCTCQSGAWNCSVAEPDPVCTCGRQPSPGDRCVMEGASCGECCPTPGGTGWPAMQCVSGHWEPAACPAIVCPVLPGPECPANTTSALGTACTGEGSLCGDACCDTAIVCTGGIWRAGPVADCFACTSYACGDGSCPSDQTCVARCGPADGIQYVCAPRDSSCSDCTCILLTSGQTCEMIDGHPHVSDALLCG